LVDYIYDHIIDYIKQQYQFMVVSLEDKSLDCIIDMHLIKSHPENENIEILSNIIEPKNNTIIYSVKNDYKLSDLIFQRYLAYKRIYKPTNITEESASLLVKAVNINDSFKEDDELVLYNRYSYGLTESFLLKYEYGRSSFYPAEQTCIIGGKPFKMNANKILYNNKIPYGTVEIIASFREGTWDAKKRRQYLGKRHSKKFYIDINKNDDIKVTVFFICKSDKKDIMVKAFKEIEIRRDKEIETHYEVIDVFTR